MRVLIINGSSRLNRNCSILLKEVKKVFDEEKIEVDQYDLSTKDIHGCIACNYCASHEGCVFKDDINDLNKRFENADGLIVISPVYFGSANGSLISLLDRFFIHQSFPKLLR